jgi:hypothetical protein
MSDGAVKKYHIIISGADEKWVGGFSDMASHLAPAFGLSPEAAEQVLKSAPVAFITNVDKDVLRTLKPKLMELSKKGIEFMVASKLPATMPRLIWPAKLNFQELPGGETVQYVDFQWRGNAFVCPNCAETFVFKRVGNPFNTFIKAKELQAAQASALGPDGVVEVEPIVEDVGVSDTPGTAKHQAAPPQEDEAVAEEEAVVEPPIEEPPAEGEEEAIEMTPIEEPAAIPEDGVVEMEPVLEEAPAHATSEPIDILQEAPQKPAPKAAASQAEPEPEEPMMDEANEFSLFLTAITHPKREEAAEMIADIKGIPLAQARLMANRSMVPVLKDVSETVAKECLERFKKIGLAGKIIKKK